jgi:hypothetical protein
MSKIIDMTGKKSDRLIVLAWHPRGNRKGAMWLCRCQCGTKCVVLGYRLRVGKTRSCGCLARERGLPAKATHGLSHTRSYQTWKAIKRRCFDPRHWAYLYYGGRGITVCERWLIFENFYADMGDPPPGTSLDRINNDGNYEMSNCRWATRAQQAANRRSRRHSKQRRERSSSAALQRYIAATRHVHSEVANREAAS